jgi:hypothetical protein
MLEVSVESFFGRNPGQGILVADANRIAVATPERFNFLKVSGFYVDRKDLESRGAISIGEDIAYGTIVKNYRISSVAATPGSLIITIHGDLSYATVGDFYEMLKIPPGIDVDVLLKALHREMGNRSA